MDISYDRELTTNNPYAYISGKKYNSMQFTLNLWYDGILNETARKTIAEWLFVDNYKEFYSLDDINIKYYCMPDGKASKYITGSLEGYFTINFICSAPWAFTPLVETEFDLSMGGTTEISINNTSNIQGYIHKPEIEIEMAVMDNDVTLINKTNDNKTTEFTGLIGGSEIVYVDNQNKIILTNQPSTYRYNNFNGVWFELLRGINLIDVTGEVILTVKEQYPIIL